MELLRHDAKNWAAAALFLTVAELAARVAAPAPRPWLWPQTRFEPSPTLGFRLRPNQRSYTADEPFRTNSLGLRGGEVTRAKPPGVRRVLVLGDSIASGFGVAEQEAFPARLERLLGGGVQVLNAGTPSYNTAQEVSYLVEQGATLDPDAVVLTLYWNDIHDKAGIQVDAEGRLVERFASGPPGMLRSEVAYRARNWVKRSRFLYLASDRARAAAARIRPSPARETQLAVLEGRAHPRVEQGWRMVEAELARFARLCRARGIRPLVVIVPAPQQMGGAFPRARYQSEARAICERQGLTSLDLLAAFEAARARGVELYLPYDGDHPNAAGHALIAEQVAAALGASREES